MLNLLRVAAPLMLFALLFLLEEVMAQPQSVRVSGEAQGTTYTVQYTDANGRNFKTEIDSLLEDFDKSLSLYRHDSEISEFNRNGTLIFRSPYFYHVLQATKIIYQTTAGAFDPTVGPLVNAYGFGSKRPAAAGNIPLDFLLSLVGFDLIQFDEHQVSASKPGIQLDFNGIAQGYSVDLVAQLLEAKGITHFMVEIGGEILCKGKNASDKSWTTAIENPIQKGQTLCTLKLENIAVTTAGSYRNQYERDGQIFSHIVHPKTGIAEPGDLLSVTVFAKNTITADGFDTALMVMGFEEAKAFLDRHPELDALLVGSGQDGIKIHTTPGIRNNVEFQNNL